MSDDKPLTPRPGSLPRQPPRLTDEEWERERMARYVVEMEEEQRRAVPHWAHDMMRDTNRDIQATLALVRATNESVKATNGNLEELSAQIKGIANELHGVRDAVKGRDGVEDKLERHQEAAGRDFKDLTARLVTVEQWKADRDRADTIRISEAQRGWWDKLLAAVGASLVTLALGGGVMMARGCEPAPALVKAP